MNPILLQKQLKENANDLQDFCYDLKSWGEEMKRKEDSLKKSTPGKDGDGSNKTRKAEKKIVTKEKKQVKPITKIGATDYAAWDKFDVDAECEKLESSQNDDSDLTDEFDESSRDKALIEKEKGNKFVKMAKWDEAIKCYTDAINFYLYDPVFYANRALCHLKKQNFINAEDDCTTSLKIDSTYVKAYQRRAAARESLNKLELAQMDLLKVLEFEPNNKESKASLENLRRKVGHKENLSEQRPVSKFTASRNKSQINSVYPSISTLPTSKPEQNTGKPAPIIDKSDPLSIWPKEDDIVLVKPFNKPPHLRSKKPLKRVEITETEKTFTKNKIKEPQIIEVEAVKKHVIEKQEIIEENTDEPVKTTSAFKKKRMEKSTEKIENQTAWPRPNDTVHIVKSDDLKIIEKKNDVVINKVTKEIKNNSNMNISKETLKTEESFAAPKTSVQFYKTWKSLNSSEEKYKYLKLIKPQDLPHIFQESLEINVFSDILEVLCAHFIECNEPVTEILLNFTKVKRFSAFTIFMESSDKNRLWKLFDYMKEHEHKSKEDVDSLLKKYEL